MGREGSEDGDGCGGDFGVGKLEIVAYTDANGVPEVGSEAGGADEVECELFGHSGGRRGNDFLNGGLGEDGYVAARGGLLEGLEESAGLAESVVGPEVRLDLSEEDVHLLGSAPDPTTAIELRCQTVKQK